MKRDCEVLLARETNSKLLEGLLIPDLFLISSIEARSYVNILIFIRYRFSTTRAVLFSVQQNRWHLNRDFISFNNIRITLEHGRNLMHTKFYFARELWFRRCSVTSRFLSKVERKVQRKASEQRLPIQVSKLHAIASNKKSCLLLFNK